MKKTTKILSLACTLFLMTGAALQAQTVNGVWNGSIAESFVAGSGTVDDPYQISNGAELAKLAQDVNGGTNYAGNYFKLTANIVLNDTANWTSWDEYTAGLNVWTPIGNFNESFAGILDGQGHVVCGIYVSNNNGHQGLVGYLDKGGVIQNLGVEASYIKGMWYIGGVCGFNYGMVTNCYNTGSVAGINYVGGVCGTSYDRISGCYNTGNITGSDYVGGLCGFNASTLSNNYNTGKVTGRDSVGGLCGFNGGTLTNNYNVGDVIANDGVGGVCGFNGSILTNNYNVGDVTANDGVGGVCGFNGSVLSDSYNVGMVTGNSYIGGVIGENGTSDVNDENQVSVTNCYYLAETAAGGINGNDVAGQAEVKTEAQFKGGNVAWLLQNGQEEDVWGQTIDMDNAPIWQTGANKIYKISLQIEGEETNEIYANSGAFSLPVPADREGYTFVGWFTAQTEGEQIEDNAVLTADMMLYAQWKENDATGFPMQENASWQVYCKDGVLHIVGTDAETSFYDLSGSLIYRGNARIIYLPAGVYIANAEGQVQKVVVR